MKKYVVFLFLIGIFSFVSCSDDDNDRAEPILGDWILTEVNPAVIDPTACPNDTTVSINGDNTLQSSFYLAQNDCNLQEEIASWSYDGNNTYTMSFPEIGDIQGVISFSNPDTFTFTTEAAIFTFTRLL